MSLGFLSRSNCDPLPV